MKGANPYLNFSGNAEEAFNFYKGVFGGEFMTVMRWKDMPERDTPEAMAEKILHIALPLCDGVVLMGSDIPQEQLTKGNNNYIALEADSKEEADRLFAGLSDGGSIEMPLADQFWGDYFGNFTDKFGTGWMISFRQGDKNG